MIDFVTDVSAVRMGPGNEPTFTQTTQDVLGKKRNVNMIKNSCTFGDRGMAGRGELSTERRVSVGIYFNWESKDSVTHEVSKTLSVI